MKLIARHEYNNNIFIPYLFIGYVNKLISKFEHLQPGVVNLFNT